MKTRRTAVSCLFALLLVPAAPGTSQGPAPVHHIGFLGPRAKGDPYYEAWLKAMRELGYKEGKNLVIEWRFAEGDFSRLPALAGELAAMKLEAIVTHGIKPVRALQKATSTIPIVVAAVTDAVGNRIVASLAQPGGNTPGSR